jgi:predicted double-glycine peptidase
MSFLAVPFSRQDTVYSCGAAVAQMVLHFYGIIRSESDLMSELRTNSETGTAHEDLIAILVDNSLYCYVNAGSSIEEMEYFLGRSLPCVVHYLEPDNDEGHYAVAIGVKDGHVVLNDPWHGERFRLTRSEFERRWSDERNRYPQWLLAVSPKDIEIGRQFIP